MLVTLTLIPSNPVFFNQLISSSLLCLLICVGFFPHLLLSCSLSLLCSFSVFFFFILVLLVSLPLGLSLSLSLVLSGFLFSLLLPLPPLILVLCHPLLSQVLKGVQDHLDLPPG